MRRTAKRAVLAVHNIFSKRRSSKKQGCFEMDKYAKGKAIPFYIVYWFGYEMQFSCINKSKLISFSERRRDGKNQRWKEKI